MQRAQAGGKTILLKVKSHIGIHGNEMANKQQCFCEKAVRLALWGQHPTMGMSQPEASALHAKDEQPQVVSGSSLGNGCMLDMNNIHNATSNCQALLLLF